MTIKDRNNSEMLRTVFDIMPSLIFIVDEDVRIQEYNASAAALLSVGRETVLKRRGGEVLHCIHATEVPDGCGRAPFCNHCIIRNSVTEAFHGNRVVRRRTKIEIIRNGNKLEIYSLITASPFRFKNKSLVLLVIEDINEIAELQRLITICSVCRELRDEKATWFRVEEYFKEHWDVDFTHGLCPKCYKAQMDKIEKDMEGKPGASTDS